MPRVTYISQDQKATTLDIPVGTSVMQAAVLHGIDGIVAECGGSLSCATCHVFVREDCLDKLTPMEPMEDEMLYGTVVEREENSRLSCQLKLTEGMDLYVTTPETQV